MASCGRSTSQASTTREDAGLALSGKHAPVAAKCAACHKTRSFLTAKPACATCHEDKHKGALGRGMRAMPHAGRHVHLGDEDVRPHPHRVRADGRPPDDHVRVVPQDSQLQGREVLVVHELPRHARIAARVSATCTTCHTTATWRTKTFDHARTAFPLRRQARHGGLRGLPQGAGRQGEAGGGHVRDLSRRSPQGHVRKKDCKACHTESAWTGAAFDHLASTGYALADKHATVTCRGCHTGVSPPRTPTAKLSLDYRGLKSACAACHADPHKTELGSTCERCHSVKTFKVSAFTHAKPLELFTGQHARVACTGCHTASSAMPPGPAQPKAAAIAVPRFTAASTACASCHKDPHLGQVGTSCESCHSVSAVKFAADRFSHDRTKYPLTGKHQPLACTACHAKATQAFPAGAGTATRLTGIGTACASCHKDVHLGQIASTCETCHTPATFKVMAYKHLKPPRDFFVGSHLKADCKACHAQVTRAFPAGRGTAINFSVGTACLACHEDPHSGSLGTDCARCHRPEPLRPSHARPLRP